MPQLPASAVRTLRPQTAQNAVPGPIPVPPPAPAPAPPANTVDLDVIGPRKLIRPTLPDSARRMRRFQRQDEPALIARTATVRPVAASESSHAEAFYLQKQAQTQTPMVFVLDDGERIEGCIEWYDRNAIKVRATPKSPIRASRLGDAGTRILIYKSSIKYLYKAGENSTR